MSDGGCPCLPGFGTAYSFTKDARFLQTAELNAQFYIEQSVSHGVPPNDWAETNPCNPLTGPAFLANGTPGWEGVLKQGMYHERRGLGVNESVLWGDYFFLEAVGKVLGYE